MRAVDLAKSGRRQLLRRGWWPKQADAVFARWRAEPAPGPSARRGGGKSPGGGRSPNAGKSPKAVKGRGNGGGLKRAQGAAKPAPVVLPAWAQGIDGDEDFVREAYVQILDRPGDPGGVHLYTTRLAAGVLTRAGLVELLKSSPEALQGPGPRLASESLHRCRMSWMQNLPPARRILDLGGTALGDDRGALVAMGYHHQFEDLVIIELPEEERHELYQVTESDAIQTEFGPVRYLYRSMCDLDDLPDASFDMICSGQTFEHIYPVEGAKLLHDVARLLAPGGVLALDTPNGAVSSIQAREEGKEFINPDHKVEYTHQQMLDLFDDAGLRVDHQQGVGWMPKTADTDTFLLDELIENPDLVDDIERSFILCYLASRADAATVA